jgi:hypothetical protein
VDALQQERDQLIKEIDSLKGKRNGGWWHGHVTIVYPNFDLIPPPSPRRLERAFIFAEFSSPYIRLFNVSHKFFC